MIVPLVSTKEGIHCMTIREGGDTLVISFATSRTITFNGLSTIDPGSFAATTELDKL